jgi:hypothetical protein
VPCARAHIGRDRVFWGQPTGKVVALLAGLLLVALALIEFLGRPPERTAEITTQT